MFLSFVNYELHLLSLCVALLSTAVLSAFIYIKLKACLLSRKGLYGYVAEHLRTERILALSHL